jgi:SPP1 gp7 family putative phage head morphogenesis protein
MGRNPRETARLVRKATGMGLNRALTIARTEQMRVYNEAALATYREMGVTRYEILPAYDDRTCIACLSRAGEIVSSEMAVSDHVQGRCTAVPCIDGLANPVIESSESWFGRQPQATQLSIMGPGRLAAYRSGQARWSDFATTRHDPKWGDSVHPTPVRNLRAVTAAAA